MNKKLLGIFCVAAASLAASAQSIPSTYNYQGVCGSQNADVEVVFNVLANGQVVYSEAQTVRTNRDGAFTALVGNGNATVGAWDAIDWTNAEYALETSVDGKVVANCPMVAVPYATVAERVLGMDQLNEDLQAMDARIGAVIETMADAIAEATEEATAANIKAETYYNSLKAENEEVFTAIDERINDNWEQTEEAIHTLFAQCELISSGVSGELDAIKADLANIDENSTMFNEVVEEMLAQIADAAEAAEAADLKAQAGLESLDAKFSEAINNLDALINNIDENGSMSADLINTMLDDIEALKANIANIDENAAMSNEMFDAMHEAIDANAARIEQVNDNMMTYVDALQASIEELGGNADEAIQEAMAEATAANEKVEVYYKAMKSDFVEFTDAIKADLANIDENSTMFNEVVDEMLAQIADAKEAAEAADLKAQANYETLDAKFSEAVNNLDALINNIDENGAMEAELINTMLEDIEALQKNIANVDENGQMSAELINTMLEDIASLQGNIANIDENATMTNEMLDSMRYDIEKALGFEDEITTLKTRMITFTADAKEAKEEAIAANTKAEEYYKSVHGEVITLQEQLEQEFANLDNDLNNMDQRIGEQIVKNAEAIYDLEQVLQDLESRLEALENAEK